MRNDNNSQKILFINTGNYIAGAEISMQKMIKKLVEKGHEVEVLFEYGNPKGYEELEFPVKTKTIEPRNWVNLFRGSHSVTARLFYLGMYMFSKMWKAIFSIQYLFKKYDAVIINKEGMSPRFACRAVNAKCRILYVRTDIALSKMGKRNVKRYHKFYDKIDFCVGVSQKTCDSFKKQFPMYSDKTKLVYGIIEPDRLIKMADDGNNPYTEYQNKPVVVTVGRLQDKAKAVFRVIEVMKKLTEEGLDFYWFLVGGGPDYDEAKKLCARYELNEKMIFTGHKSNPYPYLKHADISALLSYYEGFCGVVYESKILKTALITTDFAGADEQVENEVSALIVDNDFDAICEGMRRIISDSELRNRLAGNPIKESVIDDDGKVEAFLGLIKSKTD